MTINNSLHYLNLYFMVIFIANAYLSKCALIKLFKVKKEFKLKKNKINKQKR